MVKQEKGPRIRIKPPTAPGGASSPVAVSAPSSADKASAAAAAAGGPPPSSSKKRGAAGGSPPPALPPLELPPAVLELQQREDALVAEHRAIERQIWELESKYLSTSNPYGNAMKGYAALSLETADRSKRGAVKEADRLFSHSSTTGQLPEVTGVVPAAAAGEEGAAGGGGGRGRKAGGGKADGKAVAGSSAAG